MEKAPDNEITTKASGWVLATKLGDDPEILNSILMDNPEKRNLLIQGIGWGISASLMHETDKLVGAEIDLKVNEMVEIIFKYPEAHHELLIKGIEFSFSNRVTPQLNQGLLIKFKEKLNKQHTTCLLYTSPSPRDQRGSRMPSSA